MDAATRQAQLLMKGVLSEQDLSLQISTEAALCALREVGIAFPDVIEFAATLYAMELQAIDTQPKKEETADPEVPTGLTKILGAL